MSAMACLGATYRPGGLEWGGPPLSPHEPWFAPIEAEALKARLDDLHIDAAVLVGV